MSGKLYGLGLGPGDPELITLKALNIIKRSSVIAYPAPDDGESFARSIVAEHIDESQLEIPIVIPMRRERYPAQQVFDEACKKIRGHLISGSDVVVLCEGDPFFYGSFMYVFERLQDEFECEIVPGISSIMASSSVLQRPMAARNESVIIIPAPLDDEEILRRMAVAQSIIFIKVGRHLARIRALIESQGLLDKAGYVERATLPNQKSMPLSDFNEETAPYFSILSIYKGDEPWPLKK